MTDLDTPVVVVVSGDLHLTGPDLDNARAASRVVEEINRLIRPDFVPFIGDHDVKGDPTASAFRRQVGEPFGATSSRGSRFIRLDTQESHPLGLSALINA